MVKKSLLCNVYYSKVINLVRSSQLVQYVYPKAMGVNLNIGN